MLQGSFPAKPRPFGPLPLLKPQFCGTVFQQLPLQDSSPQAQEQQGPLWVAGTGILNFLWFVLLNVQVFVTGPGCGSDVVGSRSGSLGLRVMVLRNGGTFEGGALWEVTGT